MFLLNILYLLFSDDGLHLKGGVHLVNLNPVLNLHPCHPEPCAELVSVLFQDLLLIQYVIYLR